MYTNRFNGNQGTFANDQHIANGFNQQHQPQQYPNSQQGSIEQPPVVYPGAGFYPQQFQQAPNPFTSTQDRMQQLHAAHAALTLYATVIATVETMKAGDWYENSFNRFYCPAPCQHEQLSAEDFLKSIEKWEGAEVPAGVQDIINFIKETAQDLVTQLGN